MLGRAGPEAEPAPVEVTGNDAVELRVKQQYADRLNADIAELSVQKVLIEAQLGAKVSELIQLRQALAQRARELAMFYGINPEDTTKPYRLDVTQDRVAFFPVR